MSPPASERAERIARGFHHVRLRRWTRCGRRSAPSLPKRQVAPGLPDADQNQNIRAPGSLLGNVGQRAQMDGIILPLRRIRHIHRKLVKDALTDHALVDGVRIAGKLEVADLVPRLVLERPAELIWPRRHFLSAPRN